MKINIAVLASGRGSNFQAILDAIDNSTCNAQVKVLITNNPNAEAIKRAKAKKIPVEIVEKKKFKAREEMDEKIYELLDNYDVELVVLAGYMLVLKGKKLLEKYRHKIINIHPALLPAFPGLDAQKQAFDYGCKVSGVTVHFVDESLDGGPIIHQEAVEIFDCNSPEEVSEKILKKEHEVYPKVIDMFAKGKFIVNKRRILYKLG